LYLEALIGPVDEKAVGVSGWPGFDSEMGDPTFFVITYAIDCGRPDILLWSKILFKVADY
jgi:hypothetical protein